MSRAFFLILFFLRTFSMCYGEEGNAPSLVNLTKQPIPRIFGTVNVVSGDWVDQERHEMPSGHDSLPIAHSYTTSSLDEGNLSDAWNFSWPSTLTQYNTYEHDNIAFLYVREAGGAVYKFTRDSYKDPFKPVLEKTGYTHISSIDTPLRIDMERTDFEEDTKHDLWHVTLSDGTKRTYEKSKHILPASPYFNGYRRYDFHIIKETLPSKNIRLYSYDKSGFLKEIRTLSSCQKHLIQKITIRQDKESVIVKSLEGKEIRFSMKDLKCHEHKDGESVSRTYSIVDSISRADAPTRTYEYCKNSPRHQRRIEKRTWSTGRVEEAKFYTDSCDTTINGEEVHQSSRKRSFTKSRVREIRTKRFRGEETFTRNGFYYSKGLREDALFPETFDLSVTEPDDSYTKFKVYEKQIEALSYFDKNKRYLASEHFVWGKGKNRYRLLQRNLYDSARNPSLMKEFVYDKRGFPIEELYHGFVTSSLVPEIETDENEYKKGGESWGEKATWDDAGHLLSFMDADGNWTYFTYERSFVTQKLVCDKKHIIRREFATYDSAGNLTEFSQDDSSHREKENLEGATKRTLVRIVPRLLAPHFGEPESKKYFVWTPQGGLQMVKTEHFYRDGKGRVIRHTVRSYDDLKKETLYSYDALDRLIEKTCPDGSKETISYDRETGLVREKTYPHRKVSYSYDLLQRVISEKETFPDGSVLEKTIDYDPSGRILTIRDGRGRKEVVEKDLLGRPLRKTLPQLPTDDGFVEPVVTYSYQGRWVTATSPTGAVTKTLFSSLGKPLEVIHPEGSTTTYRYDIVGREIERYDGERLVRQRYDAKGHVTSKEVFVGKECLEWEKHTYEGDSCVATETEYLLTTFRYDQFGRCREKRILDKKTKLEQRETTEYDGFHRVTKRTTAAGDELFTYDEMDRVLSTKRISPQGHILFHEKTSYDEEGRVVTSQRLKEEGVWLKTTTKYGAYGLPSSLRSPDGTTTLFLYRMGKHSFVKKTIDPLGYVQEEALAANDTATRVTRFSPYGKKLSETRTTLTLLGKPQTIELDVLYKDKVEETIKTMLDYDAYGRMTSLREAVGTDEEVSSYKAYDIYSRCIEETLPSGIRLTYTYDGKGRLIRQQSSDQTVDLSFTYTHRDLVKKAVDHIHQTETIRQYDGFGHLLSEVQGNGLKTCYEYTDGHLTRFLLPDGTSIRYSYDGDALVKAKRETSKESYSFSIAQRAPSGLIIQTSLPFSLGRISYSYDDMGRPLSKEQPTASETRTYDLLGRTTSRTLDGVTETFHYDDLSQLISDNGISRSYDSLYRMREKEGEKATVTRRQQCTALGSKRFSYDRDGRRISDKEAILTYDALGRLISYAKEGVTKRYEYDAFSRLMKTTVSGKTEKYLWMGQQEVGSFDDENICHAFRLLAEGVGSEGGATLAVELEGTSYACLTDLSGNLRALLSSQGEVVHASSYSSFGRLESSGLSCPWGFFCKRHDDFSGYIFFLYRLYDPETCSWITQDPLGLEAGPNLYAYVKNNPLSFFDRFGLFGESFCSACSSITDAIGGFFSSAFDSCCSALSAFGSGLASCCSDVCSAIGRAFSSLESSPPPSNGTEGDPTAKTPVNIHHVDTKGNPLDPNNLPKKNLVAVALRDDMTWEEFCDKMEHDRAFRKQVLAMINGVNTSSKEAFDRAEKTLAKHQSLQAVIIVYNLSVNLAVDSFEAELNAFGVQIAVVRELAAQLKELCDACGGPNADLQITFHCHSQGAAIMDCIMHTQAFRTGGSHAKCIGDIYTYGGFTTIPGATNFIAWGDIIPLLNPLNWITMIVHPECVHFVGSGFQDPLSAHAFDGPAYQAAFESTFR